MSVAAWGALSIVITLSIFTAYYLGVVIERQHWKQKEIDNYQNK
jgi:hypothetical protein